MKNKSMKKRLISLVTTFALLIAFIPVFEISVSAAKITLLSGAAAPATIYAGHTYSLKVANISVQWSSDNVTVATINSKTGKLKPTAPGEVKITATNKETGEFVARKTFQVKQRATEITVTPAELKLYPKDFYYLTSSLTPSTSTDAIAYISQDKSVCTVGLTSGKVTAVNEGSTTITVYAKATNATNTSSNANKTFVVNVIVANINDKYKNGFAEDGSCQAPALNNGVYEISNAGQLKWFSALVNGDTSVCGKTANPSADAKVIADIDYNDGGLTVSGSTYEYNKPSDTSALRLWTPIGTSNEFGGTFDGQGHTIKGLCVNDSSTDFGGLFGTVSNGQITNITIDNSYFENTADGYAGAIATEINGLANISCCIVKNSYVNSALTSGGIVGFLNSTNSSVTSCCSVAVSKTGNIGMVGNVSSGKVSNCYYLYDSEIDSISGTTAVNATDFTRGKVAYLINGDQSNIVFGQDIGTENTPDFALEDLSNKVLKIIVKNGSRETDYYLNNQNTIEELNELDGLTLLDKDNKVYDVSTPVTTNLTLTVMKNLPTYTVTIPSKINFGTLARKHENADDKIKSVDFKVSVDSDYLYENNQSLSVSINTSGVLNSQSGSSTLSYDIISDSKKIATNTDTTIINLGLKDTDDTIEKTLTASLDQSQIRTTDIYLGTVNFTVKITDQEAK